MKTFDVMLDEYLELRRGLGFKLKSAEPRLRGFVAFLSEKKVSRITTALALQFACAKCAPGTQRSRLSAIRGFAHYLVGMDFAAEVPPPGLLGRYNRPHPYIYTDRQVEQLLALAWNLPAPAWHAGSRDLRRWTLYTLIGLLAATGMRIGEALRLKQGDVDWNEGVIRIGESKFLKSRLIPVHPTTLEKLRAYDRKRGCFLITQGRGSQPWFFAASNGNALSHQQITDDFHRILHRAGLRGLDAGRGGPRLHDLRHRFAVVTLLRWHESGKEIGKVMPILATYLGHAHPRHTYWYLSATHELMAAAKNRLEKRWEGGAR